jgi:hypothetical protein
MTFVRGLSVAAMVVAAACSSAPDDPDTGVIVYDAAASTTGASGDAATTADASFDAIDAIDTDAGDTDALVCQLIDAGAPVDMCTGAEQEPVNDVCADAIDLTFGVQCGGAFRYGDSTGYFGNLEPPAACTSNFTLDGPDAIYRVHAEDGQTITATVSPDQGYDAGLYILSDCLSSACLVGKDSALAGGIESVTTTAEGTGTYYIVVDSWSPGVEGCYAIAVTVE